MRICVYGAASTLIPDKYTANAYVLCNKLAKRGHSLVFGAGDGGMMGASASLLHCLTLTVSMIPSTRYTNAHLKRSFCVQIPQHCTGSLLKNPWMN